MKRIVFIVIIMTLLAFTEKRNTTLVVITHESSLFVKGSTNINSFTCYYNINQLVKPIPVFFEKKDGKIVFTKATLILDNVHFDCGHKGMNNDFQELLKSEMYPQIFLTLKGIKKGTLNKNIVQADLDLNIAGVTRSYTVPVKLDAGKSMNVEGILNLRISDFNLEPPKKFLGLVVVKDAIEINFQLQLKEI
ncbi:YceI family protein [Snuella sedimenti]|uniref:YceI family protein n=1 Tax=Snuella sedimenti TaxID=2798802 RepID=A0A8J7J2Y8_9FLAO|nr:YceI family protein [Snuella sedimenti]MBJ6368767.1 YceI family protein [Snuella sedimenti]